MITLIQSKDIDKLLIQKHHYQCLLESYHPIVIRRLLNKHIAKLEREIRFRKPINRLSIDSLIWRKTYYTEQMRSLEPNTNSIAIKIISLYLDKLNYLIETKSSVDLQK